MNVVLRKDGRGVWRLLPISLAFGLLGALGWAAGSEAQVGTSINFIRIQDRTPSRTSDTNFFGPAKPASYSFTFPIPPTRTAVQVRGQPSSSSHAVYIRTGTSGSWDATVERDYSLNTTGATVIQIQTRTTASPSAPVLETFTVTIVKSYILPGVVIGQATEAGGTATFPVTLGAAPSAGVTVGVASRDTSEGSVAPASLVFSTTNWNTAQTVTVTGVDDTIQDGTVSWDVRLTTGSTAPANYRNLTLDVTVRTTDDDTPIPEIVLSETALTVTEGTRPTATYTVRLRIQPTAGVEVQVARGAPNYVLNKVGGTQAITQTLTFTTAN